MAFLFQNQRICHRIIFFSINYFGKMAKICHETKSLYQHINYQPGGLEICNGNGLPKWWVGLLRHFLTQIDSENPSPLFLLVVGLGTLHDGILLMVLTITTPWHFSINIFVRNNDLLWFKVLHQNSGLVLILCKGLGVGTLPKFGAKLES